ASPAFFRLECALVFPLPGVSAMGTADDSATSLTLLNVLRGAGTNEPAWQEFCARYQPLIRRWCGRWRLQAADVDDVSQKVLQAVFTRIDSYDPARARFRGWLKTVVDNAVKDFLRGRGRRPGDQGSGDSNVAAFLQAIAEPENVESLVQELDSTLR